MNGIASELYSWSPPKLNICYKKEVNMVGMLISKSKKRKGRVCKILTVEDSFDLFHETIRISHWPLSIKQKIIQINIKILAIYLYIFCFMLSWTKKQIGTTLILTFSKDSLFLNIHDFFASFTIKPGRALRNKNSSGNIVAGFFLVGKFSKRNKSNLQVLQVLISKFL